MTTKIDLSPFIKAYDVRGLVGSQLTAEVVTALGAAFVDEVDAAGHDVVVGHDMRDSSPGFADRRRRSVCTRSCSQRGAAVRNDCRPRGARWRYVSSRRSSLSRGRS